MSLLTLALAVSPDRFLLNPAALSEDHLVQLRFLGILMAVAIRTKKPLDLHLAPWVWKQLCSMPLGEPDLEEVDLLTYRTLQGILHLDNSGITEDNFHVVRRDAPSPPILSFSVSQSLALFFYTILLFLPLLPHFPMKMIDLWQVPRVYFFFLRGKGLRRSKLAANTTMVFLSNPRSPRESGHVSGAPGSGI